ncbi:A/G-specific adenine glycosylase [Sphingomonas metalli]|uniref:Adenine DNA glycosylase n=1 Tax=Sphingomonas metalli TaxID=1779358 RepID=A0A916T525_9SPHN|nr:A/G-specific adenine glycosylase [Sphingomonas metalli]GGB28627.1 A/G-specific adenine glycosylase [Sphingomonas metalli]
MDAKRSSVPAKLLHWYDANARILPWRARPCEAADPYRVWLSEVMLQQTTVAAVTPRFREWTARWPTIDALAAATDAEIMAAWAGLGYYARARNLVKAARAVAHDHGGRFPATEAGLRALPGLGAYTAAAVAAIAFGERAVVVDANVERVVARLFAIDTPLPAARPAIRAAADTITPDVRAGDFAQAMMDLGATICTPRRPRCLLCPLREDCRAFAAGDPERLPVKAAKKARPQRHGTIFWLERPVDIPSPTSPGVSARARQSSHHPGLVPGSTVPQTRQPEPMRVGGCRDEPGMTALVSREDQAREIWLVRRPPRGLLGGMRALPTGPWVEAAPALDDAPADTEWRVLPETVAHGFTHFDLTLALAVGRGVPHGEGEWWPLADLEAAGLPTLFAKAARAVMESDR